jgi:hypothetical protein
MESRMPSSRRKRKQLMMARSSTCTALSFLLLLLTATEAFGPYAFVTRRPHQTTLFIIPPASSGYAQPEDETSFFPDTYEPMMEYPGTMRPGRTPENIPFQDLPIADTDPDPVPWPHFMQIEWHHRWEPPHEHPIPMNKFIEMQGRWTTPEFEATMRAGVKQTLMKQRESSEAEKRKTIITDDEEDIYDDDDKPAGLGEGMLGELGSSAKPTDKSSRADDEDTSAELDDFLLDLGLDLDLADDQGGGKKDSMSVSEKLKPEIKPTKLSFDDNEEDDDEENGSQAAALITVEGDSMSLGLDGDDELEDSSEVASENYGDDSLDTEDIFGEGGFDFDDGDFESSDGFDMDDW